MLKTRRVAGCETLILRDLAHGTFTVARDCTDWADPTVVDTLGLPPQRLNADSLLELVVVVARLTQQLGRRD